jgi:predicted TIM-barrel fold metal-dependent hydrolase
MDEAERCRRSHPGAGLKLHLASAGLDFRDAAAVARLESFIAWAERRRVGVLLHLDPQRRGLETEDVTRLLDRVFGPHPDVEVIVAHLGGSGGFGPWTRSVLIALGDWLAAEEARGRARRDFIVDLSAVILESESEGVPASTDEELAALAPALRRFGLARVVFGSDYPSFDPFRTRRLLAERTGLTAEEIDRLSANRAASLRRAGAAARLASENGVGPASR